MRPYIEFQTISTVVSTSIITGTVLHADDKTDI